MKRLKPGHHHHILMFQALTHSQTSCQDMSEQFPLIPTYSNHLHPFAVCPAFAPSPSWHIGSGNQPIIQDLHQLSMLRRCGHFHLSGCQGIPLLIRNGQGLSRGSRVSPHIHHIIISIVFLSGRIVELPVSWLLSLLCSSLAPSWDHVAPGRRRMAEFHISKHRRP